jgi:hypothetical protein
MRSLTLLLLCTAGLAQAAGAQQAAPAATPERDGAAVFIAQADLIVSRLATECLDVLGRAESPKAFTKRWEQTNARYINASKRYMERRATEAAAAGGDAQRDAVREAFRKAVQDGGEQQVGALLQGRHEDGCMNGITLIETGVLDFNNKMPQFDALERLAKWAEQ